MINEKYPENFDDYDYKAKRIFEYGSTKQQLEYLVENGIEAFISRNNAIKKKYPKPEN